MLIGFHGKMKRGKDQSYQFLKEWGGDTVRRDAFADRLKVSAARALGYQGDAQACIDFCNLLKQKGSRIVISTRDDAWLQWFAGLVDGEGCFRITAKGFPEFSLGLRADDRFVLEDIGSTLGIGHLYESNAEGRSPMLHYRVHGRESCLRLMESLDGRLRSKKRRDFEIWKEAVEATLPYDGPRRMRSQEEREVMDERREELREVRQFESGSVANPAFLRKEIDGRSYLQWYGTEAHREVFDQDFWIKAVTDTYQQGELLVITDVRFPNEAEAIRALGGVVVHIVRPELDAAEAGQEGHASEQVLPPELIDHTIINDGTLEDLRDKVVGYARDLHNAAVLR